MNYEISKKYKHSKFITMRKLMIASVLFLFTLAVAVPTVNAQEPVKKETTEKKKDCTQKCDKATEKACCDKKAEAKPVEKACCDKKGETKPAPAKK